VGAVLYFIFGINRIRRRASELRESVERFRVNTTAARQRARTIMARFSVAHGAFASAGAGDRGGGGTTVVGRQSDRAFLDGDTAYPAMLKAIEGAQRTLSFSTYIFDRDEAGLAFAPRSGGGSATWRGGASVD
jgi:cardiolipin synthase A/B